MEKLCNRVGNMQVKKDPDIHDIGFALVENYSSLEATANDLGVTVARLRYLIKNSLELQTYHEIAQMSLKGLIDKEIIERLKNGDPEMIKLIAPRYYAGRARGGFNIAEIGTMGYDDPLSRKIAAETAEDRKKSQVKVEFNFIRKDEREHHTVSVDDSDSNAIDAEFEEDRD